MACFKIDATLNFYWSRLLFGENIAMSDFRELVIDGIEMWRGFDANVKRSSFHNHCHAAPS
jgi:hypothetical protein